MKSRPKTGYRTKGRVKKFWPVGKPLVACIQPFLAKATGLLFTKRRIFEGKIKPVISNAAADVLAREFEHRKEA